MAIKEHSAYIFILIVHRLWSLLSQQLTVLEVLSLPMRRLKYGVNALGKELLSAQSLYCKHSSASRRTPWLWSQAALYISYVTFSLRTKWYTFGNLCHVFLAQFCVSVCHRWIVLLLASLLVFVQYCGSDYTKVCGLPWMNVKSMCIVVA